MGWLEKSAVALCLAVAAYGGWWCQEIGSEERGRAVSRASPGGTAVRRRAKRLRWVGCGISRLAFMRELAAEYERRTGTEIVLEGGGATRGVREVAARRADLGGSCRHCLPVEEESAVRLVALGWDALVVIAHPSCKVEGITLEELRAVLTGKIRSWRALGGADRPIHLVTRSQGPGGKISGVGRMIRELVFFDPDATFRADAVAVKSSAPLEKRIERDPLALGVTGISSARRRRVKLLALDGVRPSYEAIAEGHYPLFRPLYLVIPNAGPSDRLATIYDFVHFAISDEGQRVVRRTGTVTLADGARLWRGYRKRMARAGVAMGFY